MLTAMTKAELDDIRFNLNVTGVSSLTKAELAERLCPAITSFAERWMMSLLEDEYNLFRDFAANGGQSESLSDEDDRLDYLRGLGFLSCGKSGEKLVWYMSEEVLAVFRQMDTESFHERVLLNTEVARFAAGILYACGYLNYEQLFERIVSYLEADQAQALSFMDFVGIMLNASCWKNTVVALPQGVKYYTLMTRSSLSSCAARTSTLPRSRVKRHGLPVRIPTRRTRLPAGLLSSSSCRNTAAMS